jgi:GNAT superfamily N-acetyltransferase
VAWNNGFQDYFTTAQMTVDQFTHRLGKESLSPSFSFVAYENTQPIGVILNSIKLMNGKKWAWNGGTSVAPSHRKLGVGRELMNETIDTYKREGVETATLEAFSVNKKAIRLYEASDYKVIDRLLFLEIKGRRERDLFQITYGLPIEAGCLKLYNKNVPWQSQWQNIHNGESLIVRNASGKELGYALFRRVFNEEGDLQTVILYQCETEEEEIGKLMINHIFPANQDINRMTYNFPQVNSLVAGILKEAGFQKAYTDKGVLLEQVFMVMNL